MKTTVNFSEFCDAFTRMDRQETYTYAGKRAIFDYLEELENDTGEELELDVVALCCDYSEYADGVTCINECGYDCDLSEHDDEEEKEEAALDWLRDQTTVIDFNGGIIIQDF